MTDLRQRPSERDQPPECAGPLRYFPPSSDECPTYIDDTEWHPLLDGAAYLTELGAALRATVAGDTVSIVGLELDPAVDLNGHSPGEGGYEGLGLLLARLAAAGVDVRIVLASRAWASSVPGSLFGGFRATAFHARTLRSLEVDGRAPLARRVVLDFAGPRLGSNHQKAVVIDAGGQLTAWVGGVDLVTQRFDAPPHDRQRLRGRAWGWHDIAVRLRGPAAGQVWQNFGQRWREAVTLPPRTFFLSPTERRGLNEASVVTAPGPPPPTPPVHQNGTAVRVLRSLSGVKIDSMRPWARTYRQQTSVGGVHEVFGTYVAALGAARRYVYLEDQYLGESIGGVKLFELYPYLRAAATRGVRVILVGSGVRDPEDTGIHLRRINRRLNTDLRGKLAERLDDDHRDNLAVYRVERLTVHSKLLMVDDVFASIGSANMFSRSMVGTDSEIVAAVATSTTLVRDLRVAVWGEHLRVPLTDDVRAGLEDLDTALAMWRPAWGAPGARPPAALAGRKKVLRLVGP